ncbi:nucleoside triphosphate pyrophosphohydrolase family protein [Stigmatella aurantiaca]|uniref:Pyrophosphatase n=1 Tax=Stigmatella aurantiaca (strain DW4/3-1) TaxID=378806 RepID=Q08VM2_STIAD|nr:nucleoside triphosphate pyrophosphohydrolase family protein [Stigmatella aurantiaca]ADO73734.1 pyrophosphatase [Stigmatella aurantiaca DW4/3-1]EAU64525.1 putative pyrophosphatase [Stigmatella aurantiaca DW4/3-1]
MDLREYQRRAQETDRNPSNAEEGLIVPLLGLAGEVGTLLSDYKKKLRDRDTYRLFKENVAEELGDILWYVANVATKFGLELDEIARLNLKKTRERFLREDTSECTSPYSFFDDGFPAEEQLPRQFSVEFTQQMQGKTATVFLKWEGHIIGNRLTDNAYADDGYRFHDVFHLSYAAFLGWSPVMRKLMDRKRRSQPKVDEVEDGGRSAVIEEGISAYVFSYAVDHDFLQNSRALDDELLRTIKKLTTNLEVRERSPAQWEQAILMGYRVWRNMRTHEGGRVHVDMLKRTLTYSTCNR